eukprot:TRINITY_DN10792_c0_g1_i3.p1 TRINITY_DN10792_c0_g1~~TRINITY_DN10792_c0_g1_i3.p1  ORF type:complete len:266 (+),score=-25.02 TRINITY_DN10792_c0_g1_i3:113-910(+)
MLMQLPQRQNPNECLKTIFTPRFRQRNEKYGGKGHKPIIPKFQQRNSSKVLFQEIYQSIKMSPLNSWLIKNIPQLKQLQKVRKYAYNQLVTYNMQTKKSQNSLKFFANIMFKRQKSTIKIIIKIINILKIYISFNLSKNQKLFEKYIPSPILNPPIPTKEPRIVLSLSVQHYQQIVQIFKQNCQIEKSYNQKYKNIFKYNICLLLKSTNEKTISSLQINISWEKNITPIQTFTSQQQLKTQISQTQQSTPISKQLYFCHLQKYRF